MFRFSFKILDKALLVAFWGFVLFWIYSGLESLERRRLFEEERRAAEAEKLNNSKPNLLSTFDPSVCPGGDETKLTVLMTSGIAFRFEPQHFHIRSAPPPKVDPTLPPEGCKGNPLVIGAMAFPYKMAKLMNRESTYEIPQDRPDLLMIYGHDGPVRIQRSEIAIFELYKSRFGNCEVYGGVLEVCRSSNDLSNDGFPSSGALVALPGSYEEFDELPLAGGCDPPNHRNHRTCEFQYQMIEGLSVVWRVRTNRVTEERLIDLDRSIRAQIRAARAPDLDQP